MTAKFKVGDHVTINAAADTELRFWSGGLNRELAYRQGVVAEYDADDDSYFVMVGGIPFWFGDDALTSRVSDPVAAQDPRKFTSEQAEVMASIFRTLLNPGLTSGAVTQDIVSASGAAYCTALRESGWSPEDVAEWRNGLVPQS